MNNTIKGRLKPFIRYRLKGNGSDWLIHSTDNLGTLQASLEEMAEYEVGGLLEIEMVWMSQEEFEALDEHTGF